MQCDDLYLPPVRTRGRFSGDLSSLGVKVDASGGWWDAGDYLKFVETTSYTVDMMQLGVRDFTNQLGTGSTTANFTTEAKFGLDLLQNMWNDSTRPCITRWVSGRVMPKRLAITTSGACRKSMTPMVGRDRSTATSEIVRFSALLPPGR